MIKNLPAKAGDARDVRSSPESGRSPGAGSGNPLQYFYLQNLMDRGVWWALKIHLFIFGCAESSLLGMIFL